MLIMNDVEGTRATVLVSGRVQGVGFREFARRRALDHGLAGTAENLQDCRVEVVLEGARGDIDHLLMLLQRGPAHAAVSGVDVAWSDAAGLVGFHVY